MLVDEQLKIEIYSNLKILPSKPTVDGVLVEMKFIDLELLHVIKEHEITDKSIFVQ